jgi:hypothetical protein
LSSKRCVVVLLVALAGVLVLPSATFGHKLTLAKAKTAAQKFLDKDNAYYPYEAPKKVTTCERKSARTVDCAYKAVNDNGTADCGTVRVRLKTRKAKHPIARYKGANVMCAP